MQLLLVRIAAVLVALGLAWGHGYYKRGQIDDLEAQAQAKASLERARKTEQLWQDTFNDNARHLVNELNQTAVDRDSAVARLRDERKARRVPQGSGDACQGSTGAELSSSDAEFLVREAARADEQRAALMSCYSALEGLR